MKNIQLIILSVMCIFIMACNETAKVSEDNTKAEPPKTEQKKPVPAKVDVTTVSIGDLLGDPSPYDGKTVSVTGKCFKVNNMIMGRNWVHLQDAATGEHDLTITTTDEVPADEVVTMHGKVVLDKDFGSGYTYDIILEQGTLQ